MDKIIKKDSDKMGQQEYVGKSFKLLKLDGTGEIAPDNNDAAVLDQIEGYTTLIAILGGPALLIIKDALDVWKQEQAEKTAFYKVKAQAVIDYNDHAQKQAQMIESKAQEQEHKMESKK